jgi:hypothetical protein
MTHYCHCIIFLQQYINSVQSVSHRFITLFTFQITYKAHRCKGHDYDQKEKSQKETSLFLLQEMSNGLFHNTIVTTKLCSVKQLMIYEEEIVKVMVCFKILF